MPVVKPSKSLAVCAGLAAAAMALSACAGAPDADSKTSADGYPVTVNSCGTTTSVDAPPENAVTLNQGATEVALALGVEDQMAGTAYLDDEVPEKWEDAYDSVPVLADEYPDHETLLAANPDLIYASYESAFDKEVAGSPDDLAESGIDAYLSPFGCADTPDEASFETVWDEVESVATIFGVPERADTIKEDQQAELKRLDQENAGADLDVFWYDGGDKTAFAGAGQGGPQLIMDAIGATNVFADLDGGWADVSWEKVVDADPDVIVLADAASSTAKEKIEHLKNDPALKKLRAVREEAFITIPFSESTPGVRLVDGANRVASQLDGLDNADGSAQ